MEPIDPRTVRARPAPRLQWRKPPPLDGAVALVERGAESEQRRIQAERQRSVLPHIYFSLARYVRRVPWHNYGCISHGQRRLKLVPQALGFVYVL